jgi:3',5'-cyclic AMP phosphodiesterase CpdA
MVPIGAALSLCFAVGACGYGDAPPKVVSAKPAATASASLGSTVAKVAAAGDIACSTAESKPGCRAADTAALVGRLNPKLVLALGDLVYNNGTLAEFTGGYQPTWGAFKSKTFPVPGNHEYNTAGAAGYKAWWGSLATPTGTTWHSKRLGNWLVIGLDSNCGSVGGCDGSSAQGRWLAAQLKAAPKCVVATWHHPRRSSGPHGDNASVQPLWKMLADAKTELVLVGHDHSYERFSPLNSAANPARVGTRQFVVGTGGKQPYPLGSPKPGSEASVQGMAGVLSLDLRSRGYSWRFVTTDDKTRDSGSAACR